MIALGLLNLGGEEVILILLLFLMLFGADKVPEMARQLGRARAEMERAREEIVRSMKSEDEKQLDDQLAFERVREHQIAQQRDASAEVSDERVDSAAAAAEDVEGQQLRAAAAELGITTDGLSNDDIKRAIAARVIVNGSKEPGGSG